MSEILELSIVGLVIVGIIVWYFYRYAKTYRTSDERIVELAQGLFRGSPDWDSTKWKSVTAESVIHNTDGTMMIKFKLPRVGTSGSTSADYIPKTYRVMTSDWYGSPLQDYGIMVL